MRLQESLTCATVVVSGALSDANQPGANMEKERVDMPAGLSHWTADEVAECLGVPSELYQKLWGFLNDATNPTPLGGDGSCGTVEEPSGRWDEDNDDKAPHWWGKLDVREQALIAEAYNQECGW